MGFISMMAAMFGVLVVVIILACGFILGTALFIWGLVLGNKAKKKGSKVKLRLARILTVFGLLVALLNLSLGILGRASLDLRKVNTPGGSAHVSADTADRALDLAEDNSPEAAAELKKILDKDPDLIYYKVLGRSVAGNALEYGNFEAVTIVTEHGFDWTKEDFFTDGSLVFFLRKACERKITEDDVKIMDLLFERGADTALVKKTEGYSGLFGMTAWTVLYNREYDYKISDAELGLIKSVASHAEASDPYFRFAGEEPYPKVKDALYTTDAPGPVEEDQNYKDLLRLLGREDVSQDTIYKTVYRGEEG